MKRLGVGIIGCGSIAQKVHIPSFLGTPETKLVALADPNFDLAKEIALKHNIDNVFNDYRGLLECDKVDAVSVCTPPKTHCQIVVDACLASKHVLCEKPIALSLQEADKMISAAKTANITLAIGHQYRFMRNVEKSREFINGKDIGQILTCYGKFIGGGPFFDWKTSSDYHLAADSGVDVLFNYGTHIFDLFNFFFGKALNVSAFVKKREIQGVEVADRSITTIEYHDGVLATLNCSYAEYKDPNGSAIDIYGVKGKLSINLRRPIISLYQQGAFLSRLHGTRDIVFGNKNFLVPYKNEIKNFVESIKDHTEPRVSGADGRDALEIALAAYQSNISRRIVNIQGNSD